MKYIVKVIQPNRIIDSEVHFQFDTRGEAFAFMSDIYPSAAKANPQTWIEMHPFDDVKAKQEELLDGIDEIANQALREAEEEEDLDYMSEVNDYGNSV